MSCRATTKEHGHQANSHKKHHPNAGLVQHHDNGHNISLRIFFWPMIFFSLKQNPSHGKKNSFFPLNWLFNKDPYSGENYNPYITGQYRIPYLKNQGFFLNFLGSLARRIKANVVNVGKYTSPIDPTVDGRNPKQPPGMYKTL